MFGAEVRFRSRRRLTVAAVSQGCDPVSYCLWLDWDPRIRWKNNNNTGIRPKTNRNHSRSFAQLKLFEYKLRLIANWYCKLSRIFSSVVSFAIKIINGTVSADTKTRRLIAMRKWATINAPKPFPSPLINFSPLQRIPSDHLCKRILYHQFRFTRDN